MVKFANKAKGRPTKRRTLKVKYKIERKVKQHKKRVKKEAKKIKGTGLKHKGEARSDYLPNMFPFKQQILEDVRKTLPHHVTAQISSLDQSLYGMINIENRSSYLPKPKDNLIKKYVTNLEKLLDNVQVVLQLLEIRNPLACIDESFRNKCKQKNIKVISILTKIDTLKGAEIEPLEVLAQSKCQTVLKFTVDHKQKSKCLDNIVQTLKDIEVEGNALVVGKSLTGKHTFITNLAKHIGKYNENAYELNLIKIAPTLRLIDSPYKLEDDTNYPLFKIPNPILEESLFAQEEQLIKSLFFENAEKKELFNRSDILEHFTIQDYATVSEFLSKVGKAWRLFGKGGNVDINRVRSRLISEWFNGKLNHLLLH